MFNHTPDCLCLDCLKKKQRIFHFHTLFSESKIECLILAHFFHYLYLQEHGTSGKKYDLCCHTSYSEWKAMYNQTWCEIVAYIDTGYASNVWCVCNVNGIVQWHTMGIHEKSFVATSIMAICPDIDLRPRVRRPSPCVQGQQVSIKARLMASNRIYSLLIYVKFSFMSIYSCYWLFRHYYYITIIAVFLSAIYMLI
jgi:hypothetical protein